MKIILVRNILADHTEESSTYIRKVFAHIAHLIWIKDIQISSMGNPAFSKQEQIIIECMPQGGTLENADLAEKVRVAINLRSDLELIKTVITPTKLDIAITRTDSQTFAVKPYFAEYVAKNDKYRDSILNKDVLKVSIEYQQISPNSFRTTGKIETQFHGDTKISFDPNNIYHCLAAAISIDNSLKHKLKHENIEEVNLHMMENNQLKLDVKSTASFIVTLPNESQSIIANVDDITGALANAKINKFSKVTKSNKSGATEH